MAAVTAGGASFAGTRVKVQLVTLGAPGWRADVDLMTRGGEIKLVKAQAERLIAASRYRIVPPVGRYRERLDKTTKEKVKAKLGIDQPTRVPMDHMSSTDTVSP